MTFEEFKGNVEQWSKERGIYEHSTALAQALKAVSEVGELADAVIKSDKDAIKDAIGDVMVCLVNVAKLSDLAIGSIENLPESLSTKGDLKKSAALAASYISDVCVNVSGFKPKGYLPIIILDSIYWLNAIAVRCNLTLMDCCEAAWHVIKNRTGKMVAGGAFVKDE